MNPAPTLRETHSQTFLNSWQIRYPQGIGVADFNADGRLDLAVASIHGQVAILTGAGNGGFTQTQTLTVPTGAIYAVAVGDVTGDLRPDVVVTGAGASFALFRGLANGTFSAPQLVSVGAAFHSVVVGRFDQDGILDAAMASVGANNYDVYVFRGGSTGLVQSARVTLAAHTLALAAGDVDGDGKVDLVATHDGDAELLFGRGTATFDAAMVVRLGQGYGSRLVSITDLNGDGRRDLVSTYGSSPSREFSIVNNSGARAFAASRPGRLDCGDGPLVTGDFTRDGIVDVVCAASAGLHLSVGSATGPLAGPFWFGLAPIGASANAYVSLAAADLTGDGRLDLIQGGGRSLWVHVVE